MDITVQLTEKDLFSFHLYHTYHRIQTYVFLLVGIAITILSFTTFRKVEITYSLLYFACGLFFIFYTPLHLRNSVRMTFKAGGPVTKAMNYHFDEQGISVRYVDTDSQTQQQETEAVSSIAWELVYKVVLSGNAVYIYTTPRNASILPNAQVGEQMEGLKALFGKELEKFQYVH